MEPKLKLKLQTRQHLGWLSEGQIAQVLHVLPCVKAQRALPPPAAQAGNAGRGTTAHKQERLPQSHTKTLAALEAASVLFHFIPLTVLQQAWQAMTALPK